jgi:hypothetical protein
MGAIIKLLRTIKLVVSITFQNFIIEATYLSHIYIAGS